MAGTVSTTIAGTYNLSVNPTTITSDGTISGFGGASVYGSDEAIWSVTNAGRIGSGTQIGIRFEGGGSVTNQQSGVIAVLYGDARGVLGVSLPTTLTNAGTINSYGGSADGVVLYSGGNVTNLSDGWIYGLSSGVLLSDGGTLVNLADGTIAGGSHGVDLIGGSGTVVNTGTIRGQTGVLAAAPIWWGAYFFAPTQPAVGASTVINAGTILATDSWEDAVDFTTNTGNRVVVDPGAVFVGGVYGGGALSTLELASGTSIGTITGIGSQFTGFGTILFDRGADWVVAGSAAGLSEQINQFETGDTLEITGFTATGSAFSGGQLVLTGNGSANAATLSIQGATSLSQFVVTDVSGGTEIVTAPTVVTLPTPGTITTTLSSSYTPTVSPMTVTAAGAVLPASTTNATAILGASGTAWAVDNWGRIAGAGTGYGVLLPSGGSVSNAQSGTIGSPSTAVDIAGGSGQVYNAGTIAGAAGGVNLAAGGSLTNQAGGRIFSGGTAVVAISLVATNKGVISATGNDAVGLTASGGTLVNASGGTISAQGTGAFGVAAAGSLIVTNQSGGLIDATGGNAAGVFLTQNGQLINQAAATIAGYGASSAGIDVDQVQGSIANFGMIEGQSGIVFQAAKPGTVFNAGVIAGSGGTAIQFASRYANRLIVEPGAIFTGAVQGGGTYSTLELGSTAAIGTLGGIGLQFLNFGTLQFDPKSEWLAAIDAAAVPSRIVGFEPGDTIQLQGFTAQESSFSGGYLTLTGTGLTNSVTLDLGVGSRLANFTVTDVTGATDVTLAPTPGTLASWFFSTYELSVNPTTILSTGDIQSSAYAVYGAGSTPWTLTNAGTIDSNAQIGVIVISNGTYTGSSSIGVVLRQGGTIDNTATGTIAGSWGAAKFVTAPGTIINAGYLRGVWQGVDLAAGGSVINQSGGTLIAEAGGAIAVLGNGNPTTVTNAGLIYAAGGAADGIALYSQGWITNLAGGTIDSVGAGVDGILLADGGTIQNQIDGEITAMSTGVRIVGGSALVANYGIIASNYGSGIYVAPPLANDLSWGGTAAAPGAVTVVNAGTIQGYLYGAAVKITNNTTNRVIVDPGAVFIGSVDGGGSLATLELASGSSTGTIGGLGSQFVNFGTIQIDGGADWVLDIPSSGITTPIIGFAPGDTLNVSGISVIGTSFTNGLLTLVETSGSMNLKLGALAAGDQLQVSNVANGVLVTETMPLTISGVAANQTVTAGDAIPLFSDVTISDPNAGQTETVTVTPSSPSSGTLSDSAGGSDNATTGVYTITGSAAAVTAALDSLIFTPSAGGQISFTISDTDTAGRTAGPTTTTIAAMSGPVIYNAPGAGSYVFIYYPIGTALETIQQYSGSDGTGSPVTMIVDNTNGSSYLFAFNPTASVTQTVQSWSGTDASTGAPSGTLEADIVNFSDGQTMVYAYLNPADSGGVTQTAELWSATNPDGSAAGSPISDVVNDADGSTLVYAYNPAAGVAQTTTEWSETNTDGSAAGAKETAVVDNTDGTAIVYAYTGLANGETQTATFYSSYNPASGAPIGNPTAVAIDYTAGLYSYQSSISTYDTSGNPTGTTYYSGPDASGSPVTPVTYSEDVDDGAVTTLADAPSIEPAGTAPNSETISISGTGQAVDPGFGSDTIEFLSGASDDTLVLHTGGTDTISGFDPSAGDMLDLRSLFSEAGIDLSSAVVDLSAYINVSAVGADAEVLFDPTGEGGGSVVATLTDGASLVPVLKSGTAFVT